MLGARAAATQAAARPASLQAHLQAQQQQSQQQRSGTGPQRLRRRRRLHTPAAAAAGAAAEPATVLASRANPAPTDVEYDAVIIGSGMGGLSTAGQLAAKGAKVGGLEK